MSGLQEVIRHHDEAGARADAGRLVERGIGATVVHAPVAPADPPAAADQDAVAAEPDEAAAEVPAAAEPDGAAAEVPAAEPDEAAAEVPAAEPDEAADEVPPAEVGAWCVQVLAEDHLRACEVLGIEPPEPEEPTKAPMAPWKVMLVIWVVAMIVIPLAAFWLTVNLAD